MMFRFFFLLIICIMVGNPHILLSSDNDNFRIKGSVEGSSGAKAYLVDIGIFYRLIDNGIILDSCEIENDKFEFKGNVNIPTWCAIKIPEMTKAYQIFILERGDIEVAGHIDKLHESNIFSEGSENDVLKNYNKRSYSLEEKLAMISENPESIVSLHVLDMLLYRSEIDLSQAHSHFSKLSEDIRRSEMGNIVYKRIEQLEHNNWQVLPAFIGTDISGEKISFRDFKGQYVIIDFWATWCQPCMEDMPKLVDIYEKYQDSLEVISVSLDRDINLCRETIEKANMNWRQICSGDASRGVLPLMFNVDAVPRAIIFDKNQNLIYDSSTSEVKFHDFLEDRFFKNSRL
ncbi:thioredoxin-like domain-containing protein [Sphingobacterium corticis]|uniref:Thioredoxin-like domain-containing protein n=1 Tax=Sphingobacterium corticis TaxID=1812823 RepID=A0ABW5NJ51_9SPHI